MTTLFGDVTKATEGTRELAGTAQLTNVTDKWAQEILKRAETDETLKEKVFASATDVQVLDKLVADIHEEFGFDDVEVITMDAELLEKMMKSQQSKRSRCKAKTMTTNNYISLFSAAAAEHTIRQILGKEKGVRTGGAGTSEIGYSDERLAQLSEDQEALKKEIRNIQSKKSIMKSKANFAYEDDRWQMLLKAEEQLKGLRVSAPHTYKKDELREDLKGLLAEVDVTSMKAGDLKDLVTVIINKVFADATQEPEADEDLINDEI